MPAPAALLVAAGITAVVTNPVFIHFVYDPLIAPTLERLAENFVEQRRTRPSHPARPGGNDCNDIPLNGMRRRSRSYENGDGDKEPESVPLLVQGSTASRESDEGVTNNNTTLRTRPVTAVPVVDNEEPSLLLGVQSSVTARESNENVDATATLHTRPVTAVPIVDNTTHEESSLLLGVQSSTTARDPNVTENVNSTAIARRGPVFVDNTNNNSRFGSGKRQTTVVPAQDKKKLRLEPTVAVSGLSRPVVPEWKTTASQDALQLEERRRKGQARWMSSFVDRRPLPASLTVPTVSAAVPTVPAPPGPSYPPPEVFHIPDESITHTFPQTPIYPTHSAPSTPPSTTRNVEFTPPSQLLPLFSNSDAISTDAGANSANPSETNGLDRWNGMFDSLVATQDGGLDVSVSLSVSSVTHSTVSLQANASDDSSSTFEFSVPRNAPGTPPQLPPLPTLSPLSVPSMSLSLSTHSVHSNQPTSPTSPQSSSQSPNTPLHITPSAQHPHCVHYPASPNIATVASSEIYQQHRFASPGVMSSKLSELNFISE